ncbi:MAG: acetyl-CoA carboxylase biotin carboxyl carrier protein [Planctomycetota bacterium]|nr:MAG: acetyl-CoA carboxylase biotin carboxyl carrier protein [Planctomycetota bacterium]
MDVELLERLLALMQEGDLTTLEYEHKGTKIHLCRRQDPPPQVVMAGGNPFPQGLPAANPGAPAPAPPAGAAPAAEVEEAGVTVVKAPMVGTFYRSPSPEAEPFAGVGDRVGPETVVCILEAMKVMNEIKAEIGGEVVAILAENGDPVEYGQPLFKIRTA